MSAFVKSGDPGGESRNGSPGVLKKTKVAGVVVPFIAREGWARGGNDLDGLLEPLLL